MRALLVLAHGSRREASNDEVRQLTRQLAERLEHEFAHVAAAFLELAAPSIGDGIDAAVAEGASEVVLLPFFLTDGRHIAEDIPALVADARARHPGVRLELQPYLGVMPGMLDLLLAQVQAPSTTMAR